MLSQELLSMVTCKEMACKITWVLLFWLCLLSETRQFWVYQEARHSYSGDPFLQVTALWNNWQTTLAISTAYHTDKPRSNCFQNMASPCWLPERSEFPETHRNWKGLEVVKDESWNLKSLTSSFKAFKKNFFLEYSWLC